MHAPVQGCVDGYFVLKDATILFVRGGTWNVKGQAIQWCVLNVTKSTPQLQWCGKKKNRTTPVVMMMVRMPQQHNLNGN